MSKLPVLTSKALIKILLKMDFKIDRQKGSHMILKHPDGRSTVVPMHAGETIDRGLLLKIIKKDLGLEREEFMRYL